MNSADAAAWACPLAGLIVGFAVGQSGVGGGSLMTPILVLLLGISPAHAVGSDLFFAAATKSVGCTVHGMRRTVAWRVVARMAAGSVPAAAASLFVLAHARLEGGAWGAAISFLLGITLLATALAVLLRARLVRAASSWRGLTERRVSALTVVAGVLLGVLVSFSSVGAGAIGLTLLIALYPRLSLAHLAGTDIAHALPLTLVAGLGHWGLGTTDWPLVGALLLGSVPGVVLGSVVAGRVPERVMCPLMAGLLALSGAGLVF